LKHTKFKTVLQKKMLFLLNAVCFAEKQHIPML